MIYRCKPLRERFPPPPLKPRRPNRLYVVEGGIVKKKKLAVDWQAIAGSCRPDILSRALTPEGCAYKSAMLASILCIREHLDELSHAVQNDVDQGLEPNPLAPLLIRAESLDHLFLEQKLISKDVYLAFMCEVINTLSLSILYDGSKPEHVLPFYQHLKLANEELVMRSTPFFFTTYDLLKIMINDLQPEFLFSLENQSSAVKQEFLNDIHKMLLKSWPVSPVPVTVREDLPVDERGYARCDEGIHVNTFATAPELIATLAHETIHIFQMNLVDVIKHMCTIYDQSKSQLSLSDFITELRSIFPKSEKPTLFQTVIHNDELLTYAQLCCIGTTTYPHAQREGYEYYRDNPLEVTSFRMNAIIPDYLLVQRPPEEIAFDQTDRTVRPASERRYYAALKEHFKTYLFRNALFIP